MDMKSSYALLDRVLVLKKSAIFANVPTGDLRSVAAIASELRFRQGESILSENGINDSLYLIRSGSVRVTRSGGSSSGGGGGIAGFATLGPGECFGEMAAIEEEVCAVSVNVVQECVVLRVGKEDLRNVMRENPGIGMELLRIFVRRLRAANRRIEELLEMPEATGYAI